MDEQDEEVEIAKQVFVLLKRKRAKSIEASFDVDFMMRELERSIDEVDDAESQMEEIKRQMLMSFSRTNGQDSGAYVAQSEHLDGATPNPCEDYDVIEYFKRLRGQLERKAIRKRA